MEEVLTEKDWKVVELIMLTGLSKNLARVLVYLSKVGEAISRDIERQTYLRQPEVSLATKELKELGWIKERELKREGKGRPLKCYKLAVDFREIVRGLIEKKREELKKMEKNLEELEKLVGLS